ncbi:MAG: adenosylcobinamide-GDP ribazoletransferase [Chloroflexi bacterium]|nr:adenosylcobinamide-GDP ribazoletransferase [Chloroflexota bacterium]MCI0791675.1 adenosylcobinamide-GDP ribazoletransferase [Chloroflexota bacterium]MCI0796026.1 adenosylcobinamide-GDP ribazoletransferase [Chloroflexota bacterium]MCI0840497.1 adenosylcobinamide-GDP ribazoletransferase [Chloroflexota bacterium]
MNSLRLAIGFMSILPVAPRDTPMQLASARAYFPLVGLILGGILAVLDLVLRPVLPALLLSTVLVTALIVLTRALHMDGFMDSCDALLGGFTRERRLEILKDPHVGAFAVIGVVVLLLIQVTALADIPDHTRAFVLVLFPCLARWGILLSMDLFPYVRHQGLGTAFQSGRRAWQLALGFVTALAAGVLLVGVMGIVLMALASAVAWGLGWWASSLLGGVTGDIYGAINEVSEAAVLVLAVVVLSRSPLALQSPLVGLV